ncbi:hypothetical protein [Roseibium salinum]|uniref:Uncharacterized protein n=1 Tax=Roseibium salinum TaxID=1604349 RepID=A0ABT3QYB6_9HYPH|nr:hypothetical protein [Roseibium sp. DSM 29163]MCX2721938.1 hypothetical protein [Roseibium sp. DSM 29163]
MSANSDPSECASVCEEIRQVMKRPDLSDDVLLHALSGHYDQDNSLTPGALAAGQGLPEERASVIRTMIVPPPRHGLEMPAHDLAPPLSVRFAPVIARWQRVLAAGRPQLKRAPAVTRSR